ncbi:MAG: hypothetical protein CBE24_06755 [bacterium TMED264]|nr:MAG: hypothetical protein CBE24_06755 [bacterium TMED264]
MYGGIWRALLNGKKITTIVFDIGGVLLDIHPEKTYQYISDSTDINVGIVKNRFPWDAHNEYEKGNLTNKEWFFAFRDSLPQPCCLKETDFWKAWSLLLGKEKKTVDLLSVLSQSHSTWLLSNTNPKHIQDEIEKKYLFPSLVDGAIYSFNTRCRKPDRQIYDCLLESSQVDPEECIFIDDLMENVEAARLLGIHAIHYSNYNLLSKELKDLGVTIL